MKSIKDVAERAGVSVATASRVLSGKGYASEEARQKVETAIRELDYRPNRLARSLREQKTRVIGLIISDIRNPFFSEITKSVEDTAIAHDYSVLICNTNEDPERELRSLELMQDENVAGVMMSPTMAGAARFADYLSFKFPIVTFDRKPSGVDVDCVLIDNADSSVLLTQSMIDSGYRYIAGVFGKKSYTAALRLKGFQSALTAANMKPSALAKVLPVESEGERATAEILQANPEIDAIICSSSLLAIGAYRAMRHTGKSRGFASFDDAPWAMFADPPATVIRQPTELIGSTGMDLLLKRIEDPSRPVMEISLKGELVVRRPIA